MSVKVMGQVWDTPMDRDMKLVLLAYADHADHNGENVFPATRTIAQKTGYSRRSVQRITKKLIDNGFLIPVGVTEKGTNNYVIPVGGDKLSPCQNVTGDTGVMGGGDTAMSPEPSFNRQVNSIKKGKPLKALNDSVMETLFVETTRMITFPASSRGQDILRLRAVASKYGTNTVGYLRPFWDEWKARDYSSSNTAWLDWAVSGDIPKRKKIRSLDKPAKSFDEIAAAEGYK